MFRVYHAGGRRHGVITPELDLFAAPIFEQVCQQYFWREGLAGHLPFIPEQVGSWWQANNEIDLVLLDAEHATLVECKWAGRPVGIDILQGLEKRVPAVLPETGKRAVSFAICARSGFTKQLEALAAEREDLRLYDWPGMLAG